MAVTLRLEGSCASEVGAAVDVALVIDRSSSMCGQYLSQAQAASQAFLDNMAFPPDQAAVISFAGTAQLHSGLTNSYLQASSALASILCGGSSRIDIGLNRAFEEMSGSRRVAGHTPAVILLTDGNPQGAYADDVRSAAERFHEAGIQLFTVGLGDGANAELLREIATKPDYFYQSPTPEELAAIYTRLAANLRDVPATNLNIAGLVSSQFDIVPGSFSGAGLPLVIDQNMHWYVPRLEQGSTTITFALKPRGCGSFSVNESVTVSYDDNRGTRYTIQLPEAMVDVDCPAEVTDVYISDNILDTGIAPSAQPWWDSPDIWVRHDDDGGLQHRNPQAGQRNYIYARIFNRGTAPVADVRVTFYFGAAGLGLGWPAAWTQVPAMRTIPSIPPGGSAVVSVPWDVPNIAGHFCLRVHLDADQDPLRDYRIAWENNAAQRNFHVVEYPQPPAGQCRLDESGLVADVVSMDVINTLPSTTQVEVRINASALSDYAQLRLDLGALRGRWSSLDGLVEEPDGRLLITRLPATLYGILLDPNEVRTVYLEILAPANSRFKVGLSELIRGEVVGGNHYERWLPPCPILLPVIIKGPAGATPTPSPTAVATPTPNPIDPYEPNDVADQAWGPLQSGQVLHAYIFSAFDVWDYYYFDMPAARAIEAWLRDIPAGHNYHLYVYNQQLNLVGYSGQPGNQDEHILTEVLSPGRYLVRVQPVIGHSTTQPYELRVDF